MTFSSTIDLAKATRSALIDFNQDTSRDWSMGTNYTNKDSVFETFVNKYLFPKLSSTDLVSQILGNRFNFLAQEIDFIGQYSEEYVIMDSVPINLDLSQPAELMLKRNYPKIASKLFHEGIIKKVKFTLNNNDVRQNFVTIGDAIKYATGVYEKKISDINIFEEAEIKAMLIDYALNTAKDKRTVTDMADLLKKLSTAVLNLQNNSAKHNEANLASGGAIGRYTTNSNLKDLLILTTDDVKSELLNSIIAKNFNEAGLDLTSHIISFDDLGGVFKVTSEITLTQPMVDTLEAYGDYQAKVGDIIPKGTIFTFDVSTLFDSSVTELKPSSELFAMVMDIRAVRYKRYTQGMLKEPFYNGEFDEWQHWIHYYSMKALSPFYNKVVLVGA